MIDRPGRFHSIAQMAFTFKLIDKGILRFVESQMNSHEKRERVYHSWVVFRHLKFELSGIAKILNTHKIPMTMVIGKHDKIITAKNMTRLMSLVPHAKLQIVESGHNTVISAWAKAKNEA
jgi:pimeloyl-ACP methyl ester carboxylesterase